MTDLLAPSKVGYRDLRKYLALLESKGLPQRISAGVDLEHEVDGIAVVTACPGYHMMSSTESHRRLCNVDRNAPGGEYHRRFRQPVAYVTEPGAVPLRICALGEDLVLFRTPSGRALGHKDLVR